MLSTLLVIWIAVIPVAILGAAWANVRGGRVVARPTGPDAEARQWELLTGFMGSARVAEAIAEPPAPPPPRAHQTAASRAATLHVAAQRAATATLLAPRPDLRRGCAEQGFRGRGGAGRTEWS